MNNWIKVADRMPEEEGEIIIYFKNSVGWHVGAAVWDGKNIIELCERCGYNEPYSYRTLVTHWQPLPEKPSGEKQGIVGKWLRVDNVNNSILERGKWYEVLNPISDGKITISVDGNPNSFYPERFDLDNPKDNNPDLLK